MRVLLVESVVFLRWIQIAATLNFANQTNHPNTQNKQKPLKNLLKGIFIMTHGSGDIVCHGREGMAW